MSFKMQTDRDLHPLLKAIQLATGMRPHPSTPYRWMTRGIHGVRLETWLVGGRRMTTVDAVNQFVERTTAASDGHLVCTTTAAPSHYRLAAAEKYLEENGI